MPQRRPVIWKPRYATRRMRERAWAAADLRREQQARAAPKRPSLAARLRAWAGRRRPRGGA
ncbi:MAG TPA: hypothetical protein VFA82_01625 [Gaiellaceae bacterium]|nr:hypothetical protein [Gaiellaceae bacterium]